MEVWWISLALPMMGLAGLYLLLRPVADSRSVGRKEKGRVRAFPETTALQADVPAEKKKADHTAS